MEMEKTDLLTAGNIAKTLKVPDTKVRKAIKTLGIKPTAKKVFVVITPSIRSRR